MQDLTKIFELFRFLDKETADALKAHGGPYQILLMSGWTDCEEPDWDGWCTYRVKPEPKAPEKPEVKVGSWWKDLETGNIAEVLCVYEETVFVRIEGEIKGYAWPLVYFNNGEVYPYTPPRKCEAWVNIYQNPDKCLVFGEIYKFESYAKAQGAKSPDYIATVKIEYVEGQGNDKT